MKKILVASWLILSVFILKAQELPFTKTKNRANYRTEFITYSARSLAERQERSDERFYLELSDLKVDNSTDGLVRYSQVVNLPMGWLDREVFLHTEGSRNSHTIYVNDKQVGCANDSRTPSEFLISSYLRDTLNSIVIEIPLTDTRQPEEMITDTRELIESAFIYSQPSLRIEDVMISALPNDTKKHGILSLSVVVSSSHSYAENISVGYDIYSPEKELKYYDIRDVNVGGRSRDTLYFKTSIYGAMERLWSAENPTLYDLTIYLKRNKIITEFLSLKVGFGETRWAQDTIYRNDTPISIMATAYNSANSKTETEQELNDLKQKEINTIYVSYPQPYWFYDLCNELGFYVVDRANINTDPKGGDRTKKGTLSNNPAWEEEYKERVKSMYFRSRIHPCIIAWSLGGNSGNGYTMYKTYEWLKSQKDHRPIVYGDGDWNRDLVLPEAKEIPETTEVQEVKKVPETTEAQEVSETIEVKKTPETEE